MFMIETIQKPSESNGVVACFIHGLRSCTNETWTHKNGNFFPKLLAEDFPQTTVLAVNYSVPATKWTGFSMELRDYGVNLLDLLELEDNNQNLHYVFICHSLGGLVLKQALRLASDSRDEVLARLTDKVSGIIFLSTPHHGSSVADLANILSVLVRPTKATESLQRDHVALIDLNDWFRRCWADRSDRIKCFIERIPTFGQTVVSITAGDVHMEGVQAVPVQLCHSDIARPETRDSQIYKRAVRLMEKCCAQAADQSAARTLEAVNHDLCQNERAPKSSSRTMSIKIVLDEEHDTAREAALIAKIYELCGVSSEDIEIRVSSGSIIIEIEANASAGSRIIDAIRSGELDGLNVIHTEFNELNQKRETIKRFAIRKKLQAPRFIRSPHLGSALTIVCPRKHIIGMESYIDAVEKYLPDPTKNLAESVFYVSKVRVRGEKLDSREVFFFQTNYLAPGHSVPTKIITNETNSLEVLLANVAHVDVNMPRHELVRFQIMINGFHRDVLRYIIHESMFVGKWYSHLDLNGARRWLKVNEPAIASEFFLG